MVVVAPRWQDSGYHRVRGKSKWLGGAQEDAHHAEPLKTVRTKEVDVGKDEMAGGQSIMFGYASDETGN